jgi:hypothetical protein
LRFITTWDDSRNQNHPTDSAEEAHINEGSSVSLRAYPRVTRIEFQSDDDVNALQAADVLSWAVRRDLSGGSFEHGFEPIRDLFEELHLNFEYKEEWMLGVAERIRAAEASRCELCPASDPTATQAP